MHHCFESGISLFLSWTVGKNVEICLIFGLVSNDVGPPFAQLLKRASQLAQIVVRIKHFIIKKLGNSGGIFKALICSLAHMRKHSVSRIPHNNDSTIVARPSVNRWAISNLPLVTFCYIRQKSSVLRGKHLEGFAQLFRITVTVPMIDLRWKTVCGISAAYAEEVFLRHGIDQKPSAWAHAYVEFSLGREKMSNVWIFLHQMPRDSS